jgi:hypothetical protein
MPEAIAHRAKTVSPDHSQGLKLKFVPILGRSHDQPPYELLRQETLASVVVTEISQSGSVPELQVENKLDVRVFLMDGQELIGAKQNRILNTDVLVPARSSLKIPVSCVEQGRWSHVSPTFSTGKSANHRTRSAKLSRVHQNLKSDGRHDADQGTVWAEVAASLHDSGASSSTSALSDAYAQREVDLRAFRGSLQLPTDAVGVAVFHGGKFEGLDLFDRHTTLQYFWESLVDSYAIDLLEAPVDPAQPASDEGKVIRSVLDRCIKGKWEGFSPPGEGKEWRYEGRNLAAASLVWNDEVVIHLQVFPKTATAEGTIARYRPRIRRNCGPPRE